MNKLIFHQQCCRKSGGVAFIRLYVSLAISILLLTACGKDNGSSQPEQTVTLDNTWVSEESGAILDLTKYQPLQTFPATLATQGGGCKYEVSVTPADAVMGSLALNDGQGPSCSLMQGIWSYGLLENGNLMLCQGSFCYEFTKPSLTSK